MAKQNNGLKTLLMDQKNWHFHFYNSFSNNEPLYICYQIFPNGRKRSSKFHLKDNCILHIPKCTMLHIKLQNVSVLHTAT